MEEIEERLTRVEKELQTLKRKEKEIYILHKYDNYFETFKIVGCYSDSKKVYEEAREITEYTLIKEEEIFNLLSGENIEKNDYNNTIKIEKILLQ